MVKKIDKDALIKQTFLTLKDANNEQVYRIISVPELQIGMSASAMGGRGLILPPHESPQDTSNRIYNHQGVLKFNGNVIGGGIGTVALSANQGSVSGDTTIDFSSGGTFSIEAGPAVTLTGDSSNKKVTVSLTAGGDIGNVKMDDNTSTDNSIITADGTGEKKIQQADATINSAGQALQVNSDTGLSIGASNDIGISVSSGDITMASSVADKDIKLAVNDSDAGGAGQILMTLDGSESVVRFNKDYGLSVGEGNDFTIKLSGSSDHAHLQNSTSGKDICITTSGGRVMIQSGSGAKSSQNESLYSDVNFFVSGSTDSRGKAIKGTSLFGGDVVVSGTLYAEKYVVEVDETVTGSMMISGSLVVSQSATIFEGLTVNESGEGGTENDFRVESDNFTHGIFVDASHDQVIVLSGSAMAAGDVHPYEASDINFWVSGSANSRGTSNRGTSAFAGDVAISGALAINVSHAAAGSQVFVTTEGKVGIGTSSPSYKLSVGGNMEVGEYVYHRNDVDTFIRFESDKISLSAGNETLITLTEATQDIVTIGDGGDVDFQVKTLNDDNTLFIQGSSDRVGIGLNNPGVTLHVKDSPAGIRLQREDNAESSTIDFAGSAGAVGTAISHDASTNDLKFGVFNGSSVEEIMRLRGYHSADDRQVIFLSGTRMHAGAMQPREATDIGFFVSGSIGSRNTSTQGTTVFGGDLFVSGVSYFGGHVYPSNDSTYNLGSINQRWANIYTGDLHLKNDRGDWTIVEEAEYLCVVNNTTGKKYKMMLQPMGDD